MKPASLEVLASGTVDRRETPILIYVEPGVMCSMPDNHRCLKCLRSFGLDSHWGFIGLDIVACQQS
jgi:hypothetical protein